MKKLSLILILLASCQRLPLKNIDEAMRRVDPPKSVIDSYPAESFFTGLRKQIEIIKNSKKVSDPMIFGSIKVPKDIYLKNLEALLLEEKNPNWVEMIKANFDFYEVYGDKEWGETLSTGYYEPKVKGSLLKTDEFQEPLYNAPKDLISIDLKSFQSKLGIDVKNNSLVGRIENKKVVPYFDRKEITVDKKLQNQNLEIVYLNPIDAFFIEIQGSGLVELPNHDLIRVGYAAQNGFPYYPIGKFLKDVIPLEKMSMQRIKLHLQSLTLEKQQQLMNLNPSYVFFKKIDSKAMTYSGAEVTDGRTIATDKEFYPKGALCFLNVAEPVFHSNTELDPSEFQSKPRFVFDQDIGGAIKGGGHIDLYFGSGDEASMKAGAMKERANLYYLVPKSVSKL